MRRVWLEATSYWSGSEMETVKKSVRRKGKEWGWEFRLNLCIIRLKDSQIRRKAHLLRQLTDAVFIFPFPIQYSLKRSSITKKTENRHTSLLSQGKRTHNSHTPEYNSFPRWRAGPSAACWQTLHRRKSYLGPNIRYHVAVCLTVPLLRGIMESYQKSWRRSRSERRCGEKWSVFRSDQLHPVAEVRRRVSARNVVLLNWDIFSDVKNRELVRLRVCVYQ